MTKLLASAILVCSLGIFVGCGSSDGETDSVSTKQELKRTASVADAPLNQNTVLTRSQLAKAREEARVIAGCIRKADVIARTDPKSVKSNVMVRSRGVMLRLEWPDNGADVAVVGTNANAERTRKTILIKDLRLTDGQVVVLFDAPASKKQKALVKDCADLAASVS